MVYSHKITTLNNGAQVPSVAMGTYQMKDKSQLKELVKAAIRAGYRHIDTATVYTNEDAIGDALHEVFNDPSYNLKREDIWITSKLFTGDQGYEKALAAAELSLKKLRLDYIDMYLIHFPGTSGIDVSDPANKTSRMGSWKALEELYAQKKIRAIGVSNYQINHLNEMKEYATVMPAVNQCEFHPVLYTKDLLEHTQSLGIVFEAYSSLGEGELVNGNLVFDEIENATKAHSATRAQILLAWGLQHGAIILPKSSSESRLKENFEAQNIVLSAQEMESIDSIYNRVQKRFCWDPSVVV
ncbi:hypothetical protein BB561_000062 [Smittium simulii]|uniref:NADP-dependent oxidoreductase domain-containing protein n=1 Tax=Smittium simulii TaxID=133385 RepID=A0A2T9Z0S1_9FUNG|nr:hypothetical protein BB561_000062 [Smittium simulii]